MERINTMPSEVTDYYQFTCLNRLFEDNKLYDRWIDSKLNLSWDEDKNEFILIEPKTEKEKTNRQIVTDYFNSINNEKFNYKFKIEH
jgi:hypothetical protein